jgi:hypothetical protein
MQFIEMRFCLVCFEWFKRYREGHEDLEDDPDSGQLSTTQNPRAVTEVYELVTRDLNC